MSGASKKRGFFGEISLFQLLG